MVSKLPRIDNKKVIEVYPIMLCEACMKENCWHQKLRKWFNKKFNKCQ